MEGRWNFPGTELSSFSVVSLCGDHENPEYVLKDDVTTAFPRDRGSTGMSVPHPIKLFFRVHGEPQHFCELGK